MRPEPELVTIIRRLADLEAQDELTDAELHELNALRVRLFEFWPDAAMAVVRAYVAMAEAL